MASKFTPQEIVAKVCKHIRDEEYVRPGKYSFGAAGASEFLEALGLDKRPDGLFVIYEQPMTGRSILVDPVLVSDFRRRTLTDESFSSTKVFLYEGADYKGYECVDSMKSVFDEAHLESAIKRCNKVTKQIRQSKLSTLTLSIKLDKAKPKVVVSNSYSKEKAVVDADFIDFTNGIRQALLEAGAVKQVKVSSDIMDHYDEVQIRFKNVDAQRLADELPKMSYCKTSCDGSEDNLVNADLIAGFFYVARDNNDELKLWQVVTK